MKGRGLASGKWIAGLLTSRRNAIHFRPYRRHTRLTPQGSRKATGDDIMKCVLVVLLLATPPMADESNDLLPPVQIQAGGKALDIEREGHSAPFVGDFCEDGGLCLLVGQYDNGQLRIYRN